MKIINYIQRLKAAIESSIMWLAKQLSINSVLTLEISMSKSKIKSILGTIAFGAFLVGNSNSAVMASPEEHCDYRQKSAESMHEHIKIRLEKLSERLEIKSSQLAAWDEYSKSAESLMEPNFNKPKEEADAQTIARYRAERATGMAKKLSVIADATAKLQSVLTEDQRKIFNQVSHQSFHEHHSRHGNNDRQEHQGPEANPQGMER